jgi:TonB-linked SusC/RagA family outer membrane protein
LTKTVQGAYLIVSAPGFASKYVPVLKDKDLVIRLIDDSFKGKFEDIAMPFAMQNDFSISNAVSNHENRTDYKLGASTLDPVLQGSMSGLNTISKTGAPGAGANMYLDGFNSLNANTQPLIVLDGVPYENQSIYSLISGNNVTPLTDLDIKDVENITVLKDGASIYGSKAANGVILINTLRAKNPATRINFYAYTGVNMVPNTQYKMMNAWNYKSYLADMLSSEGLTANQIQALPYINNELPVVQNWGVSGNADYYRYNQTTNWQNQVFKTSIDQNYQLNVTGGNDAALYAISFGYLNQGGSVDNTSFSRYTTRVNAGIKLTDWFKLNANMSFVYSERNLSYEGLNRNFNPVYSALIKAPFTSPFVYNVTGEQTPNLEGADVFNISNPRAIIDNSLTSSNRFRFFGYLNGIITFSKYLDLSILGGLTTDKTSEQIFMPQAGIYHNVLPSADVINESQQLRNHLLQLNTDVRFNYQRTFNYVHDLKIHLGSRYQSSNAELDWGKSYNSASDQMKTLGDGINALAQMGGSLGSWNTINNYLNADYAYLSRYFVSLNAALDGSSRFGKDANGLLLFNNRFGFFPSINGAWLISSEQFMNNQHVVNILKLRAGYSITGNDDIGNYSARYYYVPQSLLGAYGLVRGNIPNTKLQWETNKKINVGVDASFLGERLNLSADIFSARTENLLSIKSIATATGIGYAAYNDGTLQNNGIDLSISGRIIDHTNLKWDMGLNLSTYKNTLLAMSNDVTYTTIDGGIIRTKVGAPIGQFYGYKTNGVFSSQTEASAANLSIQNSDGSLTPFTAGDVKFVDRDGNHIINEADMTVIGDPNPLFIGSYTNRVQWKRFTLDAMFNFSVGNKVYNALRANLEAMSNTDNQTIAAQYRWQMDGQVTNVPKAVWGDPMQNGRFSDRWIEDGSFIRLKSVTLSYDLPLKAGFISNAQIYVTGNNLLTFTHYLGYDPEFNISSNPLYYGIDAGVTAQPRTVLLGVKIGL